MSNIVTTTNKPKSFWDKPEGLIGMIGAAAAAAGLLYFLSWFVPFMLKLGLGILGMGIVWAVILFLGYNIFCDTTIRRAVVTKYQLFCKKLHRAVINEDPIGVLRLIQTKAKKRKEEFDTTMPLVREAKRSIDRALTTYGSQTTDLKAQLQVAQKHGDNVKVNSILARIGKVEGYLQEMIFLSKDTERMNTMLDQAGKVVNQIIEDTEWEINNEEIKHEATKKRHAAMGKLRSVFKATTEESEMREEALRAIAEQADQRLGQVDQWWGEFQQVLDAVNTQDEINAEKARIQMQGLSEFNFDVKSISNNPSPKLNVVSINQPNKVPVKRF